MNDFTDDLPGAVADALVDRGYSRDYVEKWLPTVYPYLDDLEEHMNENAKANDPNYEEPLT